MGVDFTACGEHHIDRGSGFDPAMITERLDFRVAVERRYRRRKSRRPPGSPD